MQGPVAMAVGKGMEGSRGMGRAARAPTAAQQAEQPRLAAVMVSCQHGMASKRLYLSCPAWPGLTERWRCQGLLDLVLESAALPSCGLALPLSAGR